MNWVVVEGKVRQGQQAKLDQCESLQGTPGHSIYLYSLEAGFGEVRVGEVGRGLECGSPLGVWTLDWLVPGTNRVGKVKASNTEHEDLAHTGMQEGSSTCTCALLQAEKLRFREGNEPAPCHLEHHALG